MRGLLNRSNTAVSRLSRMDGVKGSVFYQFINISRTPLYVKVLRCRLPFVLEFSSGRAVLLPMTLFSWAGLTPSRLGRGGGVVED